MELCCCDSNASLVNLTPYLWWSVYEVHSTSQLLEPESFVSHVTGIMITYSMRSTACGCYMCLRACCLAALATILFLECFRKTQGATSSSLLFGNSISMTWTRASDQGIFGRQDGTMSFDLYISFSSIFWQKNQFNIPLYDFTLLFWFFLYISKFKSLKI